jgi:hypothetical protein
MYDFLLFLHNVLRWVVMILAILAVVFSWIGWLGRREWLVRDQKIGTYFAISMDVQLLLGLILYFFFSPYALIAMLNQGLSFVVSQSEFRFFSMEHFFYMVVALVFAHLGSVLSKKAPDSLGKYRRAAIFYSLSLILILVGIPWWRPLLRI